MPLPPTSKGQARRMDPCEVTRLPGGHEEGTRQGGLLSLRGLKMPAHCTQHLMWDTTVENPIDSMLADERANGRLLRAVVICLAEPLWTELPCSPRSFRRIQVTPSRATA